MRRRDTLLGAVLTLALPGRASVAQQAYPERAVTIINPFAPGGQTDPIGRFIALRLQRAFGQPFVFDNRTGAGGTIGAQHVVRAAPDGHTLLLGTTSTYAIAPFVYGSGSYHPETAFAPILVVSQGAMVLATQPRTGFKSVADVVWAAKARPAAVTIASAGTGSLPHVMGELFASLAGVRLTHVPYRGGAPAMNDLIGGQVDLFFEVVSNVAQHAEAGRVVPLMASGMARPALLPAVPTTAEVGFPELDLASWTGLAAPAGTPAPTIAALNREVNAALVSTEGAELLTRIGVVAVGGSPRDMQARITREGAIYRRIILANSISVQ